MLVFVFAAAFFDHDDVAALCAIGVPAAFVLGKRAVAGGHQDGGGDQHHRSFGAHVAKALKMVIGCSHVCSQAETARKMGFLRFSPAVKIGRTLAI